MPTYLNLSRPRIHCGASSESGVNIPLGCSLLSNDDVVLGTLHSAIVECGCFLFLSFYAFP